MNETQIRELLETAGQDIAAEPIDADSLLAASRRSARTRRLVQVLSVSTAVAVIVALGLALIPRGSDPQKPSTEPVTEERLAPPGMRLVGMNGVAVAVPEDWGTNQTRCDVAVENTVVFDKGTHRWCRLAPFLTFRQCILSKHPRCPVITGGPRLTTSRRSTVCGWA